MIPLVAVGLLTVVGASRADAAPAPAPAPAGLGTAASFAVLAGTTVTNTGPSTISGDLGVSLGHTMTGFPPGKVTAGTVHVADAAAAQAQRDAATFDNDAAQPPSSATMTGDLGGQTLAPGVRSGSALALDGTLTLDAGGNPNAVFVLRATTLVTGSNSAIKLINGASACNVFWQVGSSATLGSNSTVVGTVVARASVTADTGTSVAGRLLAQSGAVTLDSTSVTAPTCVAPPAATTTGPVTTPTPSAVPTTPVTPAAVSTPAAAQTPIASGTSGLVAQTDRSASLARKVSAAVVGADPSGGGSGTNGGVGADPNSVGANADGGNATPAGAGASPSGVGSNPNGRDPAMSSGIDTSGAVSNTSEPSSGGASAPSPTAGATTPSTPTLAGTGTDVVLPATTGLSAIIVGVLTLLASRRKVTPTRRLRQRHGESRA